MALLVPEVVESTFETLRNQQLQGTETLMVGVENEVKKATEEDAIKRQEQFNIAARVI